MKIFVTDILMIDQKNIVSFQSNIGNGKASWNGDPPTVNIEYYVEVEIHDNLSWGDNIIKSSSRHSQIELDDSSLILTGKIESIDDDGYTVIRLGESIICIEALGTPLSIGTYVSIHGKNVEFFNQNYI
ncbi:hypothetical protein [Paenibacillus tarimensis]|uniref:hypothetical protein n=1 Tax=Paenibacillus tarimensis TaxID=416012 RepID=UPI001F1A7B8E|nr:hypothetical protein [Paenibacillus tarimensis]MCF2946478.1 hypothetical protein [Paenibacillus tarimensis]